MLSCCVCCHKKKKQSTSSMATGSSDDADHTASHATAHDDTAMEDADVIERYKTLTIELEAKAEVLVAILNEKDYQMQKMRQQYDEILTTLEEKEQKIVDLEFELMSAFEKGQDVDKSLLEKSDKDSEKNSSFYRHEIEEKDEKIEKLKVDLNNCTRYLQEILNKELWAKNKEIEKLHNKQANSPEISRLKKDLMCKEYQLNVLKEKISELGLDIDLPEDVSLELPCSPVNMNFIKNLQDQLENTKIERNYFKEKLKEYEATDFARLVQDLETKNEILKEEMERSEKLREKSNEVCTHLSTRLEELAVFLDSLLKQKSVLGFLGSQKERKLREIINSSLDISKSFAMSMIINPDQSLAQLSNITALLNGSTFQDLSFDPPQAEAEEAVEEKERENERSILSIVPSNITLTYRSHLYKVDKNATPNNEQVINALREQIFNLQSELKLRDNELNKLNSLKEITDNATDTDDLNLLQTSKLYVQSLQAECQSESEAWSEPDINVSRQRIGLSQTLPVVNTCLESTENDSLNNTTPTKKSSEKRASYTELHHQISQLQEEVKAKSEKLRVAEENLTKLKDVEAKLAESKADLMKASYTELHNQISRLQEEVKVKNEKLFAAEEELVKLKDAEAKLAETKADLVKAENRVKDVEEKAELLKRKVEELVLIKNELQERMVVKDKETLDRINTLEAEKLQAVKQAEEYESEGVKAKEVLKELDHKLKTLQEENAAMEEKLRSDYDKKMRRIEEEFAKKLKEMEAKADADFKEIQDDYSRNYVRKSEVEEKLNELEKLRKEIAAFKSVVRSYEERVDEYVAKERAVSEQMQDYQKQIKVLTRDLDNVNFKYSEAILEKTKLTNEKTVLEQEVNKYQCGGYQLKKQVQDIRTDFEKSNDEYRRQIKYLQKCKGDLEMKISVLESTNAELHNKLVKLQVANKSDFNYSLPILGSTKNVQTVQIVPYRREISTSEEVIFEECADSAHTVALEQIQAGGDNERREANNSSPDLGIESDQGRFSSLEIANVPRPWLQTVELTESMSNLIGNDETVPIESVTCESKHCCQKTLKIIHENNDLKRKVQKLHRALNQTIEQLSLANKRKKEVEKTIRNQIQETSQVLRKAKENLVNGSDNDALKS